MKWYILLIAWHIIDGIAGISDSKIPSISVYPCKVPQEEENFSVCCKTENLYTSPIFIYKETIENVIINLEHPCLVTTATESVYFHCQTSDDTRIFNVTTTRNVSDSMGVWGCGYYGGTSVYNLTESKVVTHNSGNHYVEQNQATTLTWTVYGDDYKVFLPNGQLLNTSSLNYTEVSERTTNGTRLEITIRNISLSNNGTFICASEKNRRRDAITLLVMRPPLLPSIKPVTTEFSGQYMNVNFTCRTNSLSAGPPYYLPEFNISWLYSTTAAYRVNRDGQFLTIKGIDCNVQYSRPIFCALKEGPGEWTPSTYFYPHEQCYLKPSAVPVCDNNSIDSKTQTAGIVIGSIFGVITVIGMIIYIWYRINKGREYGQSRCEYCLSCCSDCLDNVKDCCEELSDLCVDKCCTRCRKERNEFVDIEPSDLDIHPNRLRRTTNTNNSDLQHILNLYNVDETPTPQQQRRDVTGLENNAFDNRDPEQRDTDNNGNSVESSDVVVSEIGMANAATGVNQPALVLELETCLNNLSRLVNATENQVQVRRSHIVEDMMNIYTNPGVLRSRLHVKLIGESGSDWGGVSRDVFTTFWNEATSIFFTGESVHVPYLSLVNMENETKYVILGRILTHSTAILGFLPVLISKSVMMVIIYNSTEIEETALVEDFLMYLDGKDRKLIKDAITDFAALSEEQVKDVQELFFRFDMGCMLKAETFKSHLLKIARNELCVKPRALCEKIRQGIPDDHFDSFWCHLTVDHIDLLHARLLPTTEKILNCLHPVTAFGNLNRRRRRVYEFFQEFIENLSDEDLKLLLQLITGQSCVPKRNIQVDFSELGGVQRRPVFHTCSYLIELPDTYKNYQEFEQEMGNIIHSNILQFDMA